MAAPLTNTVHVALPDGCDLAATHVVFQRFGEVMGVESLPLKPPKVAVTFFDVRSAARAIEALGRSYCKPGPQVGARKVKLAADAPFDTADLAGVSSVDGEAGGAFVLEFYDIRDARRYQNRAAKPAAVKATRDAGESAVELPPGLEHAPTAPARARRKSTTASKPETRLPAAVPPPGLALPPGLEASQAVCEVLIHGLPNKLLSEPMMDAILQQAGFTSDVVVGFSATPGKPCGKVAVRFSCEASARRCVAHFAGCQWDQSGSGVTATLVQLRAPSSADMFDFQKVLDASLATAYSSEETPSSSHLSVEAPAWVPQRSSTLAADAPAFVPCAFAKQERIGKGAQPRKIVKRAHGPGSDTSTEIGDSEDEKHGPKLAAPVL
eukprot:CAMPEP_0170226392 /NCGR_PEP_ID=MMETSP0116_2-20130129/12907_1 /TAXON_ID=400756 /ORGANISM="Durinskia baltica, Strain CSIRO CS-38" /LENGTH=380 /DNA_ID=CAMNT_0010477117 /DNA_START=116 /DNA_END=1258 /DNA_ORIENTATION=-